MTKRLVIFGCGAIGAVTAAYLDRAGTTSTVVDPWYLNVETIRRGGLRVHRVADDFVAHPRILHVDELSRLDGPIDILGIAMKSYDTEWVARLMTPYLAPDALVLSLQNGINEERIGAIVGRDRVVGCVVAMSGFLDRAGNVTGTTRLTSEAFVLGELDGGRTPRLDELAALLAPVGRVTVTHGIWAALWAKLLLNVMTNAMAGLTQLGTPALWSDREMVSLMVHLGGEAVRVAGAMGRTVGDITPPGTPAGIRLTPEALAAAQSGDRAALDEVVASFGAIAAGRAGGEEGKASLLQDLIRGRRTEVDHLNGYIAANGARLGVPTPANIAITEVVHEIELGLAATGRAPALALLRRIESAS